MADTEAKKAEGPTPGQRLDDAIDATRGKISQVAGAVREKFEHGREAIGELKKKSFEDVITSTKNFAKEHPGTTLLGGIALGFLIGYIVRGRRDD